MFQSKIDLGQIILAVIGLLVSALAYYTRKEIAEFGKRLDKHDGMLITLVKDVSRLLGYQDAKREDSQL
jgi:hypothetical protein